MGLARKPGRVNLTGLKHKLGVPMPNGTFARLNYRRFKHNGRWHAKITGPVVELGKKT